MINAQLGDDDISPVYRGKVQRRHQPAPEDVAGCTLAGRYYYSLWDKLVLEDGVLYYHHESADVKTVTPRLVLPYNYRDVIMQHLHDAKCAGHMGGRRTKLQASKHAIIGTRWAKISTATFERATLASDASAPCPRHTRL